MDYVTLESGVMADEKLHTITKINYILKYIKIENVILNLSNILLKNDCFYGNILQ